MIESIEPLGRFVHACSVEGEHFNSADTTAEAGPPKKAGPGSCEQRGI